MGNPIKAFLGKSYTKNGVTKTYMLNPITEKYGWYNTGEYVTDYGREMFNYLDETLDKTYYGDTKASVLRQNIKTVLDECADSNIEGMDNLMDAMYEKLDYMSDYEIDRFAKDNAKSINLYFEYKDVTDAGVDARIINLARALNINIYNYIDMDTIPEKVQMVFYRIEDFVDFDEEFNDSQMGRINRVR